MEQVFKQLEVFTGKLWGLLDSTTFTGVENAKVSSFIFHITWALILKLSL